MLCVHIQTSYSAKIMPGSNPSQARIVPATRETALAEAVRILAQWGHCRAANRNGVRSCRRCRQPQCRSGDLCRQGPTQLQSADRPCREPGARKRGRRVLRAGDQTGGKILARTADAGSAAEKERANRRGGDGGTGYDRAARARASGDAGGAAGESGLLLAAPSANRSGAISPTTARHVADGLGEQGSAHSGWRCVRSRAGINYRRRARGARLANAATRPDYA